MIYEYADGLKGHIFPFLNQCFEASIQIVTDKHSSEARSSASLTMAKLFESTLSAVKLGFAPQAYAVSAMESCIE